LLVHRRSQQSRQQNNAEVDSIAGDGAPAVKRRRGLMYNRSLEAMLLALSPSLSSKHNNEGGGTLLPSLIVSRLDSIANDNVRA
jgi:hypothetical protein